MTVEVDDGSFGDKPCCARGEGGRDRERREERKEGERDGGAERERGSERGTIHTVLGLSRVTDP